MNSQVLIVLIAAATAVLPPASACQPNATPSNCSDLDTVFSNVSVVSNTAPVVPEPGTFALLIPALGGLGLAVRRRYKAQS